MVRKDIEKLLVSSIRKAYGDISIPQFSLEAPENPEHGDYATNIAMLLAKILKKNPMDVAREITVALDQSFFEKIEVAPPGFINLRLKDLMLVRYFQKIDTEWGKSNIGAGKTIIVEYFQLNIGKLPHVGHLRSAIIGDALKRMFSGLGYSAISDTHIGDWGTQQGMLIAGYKAGCRILEKSKMEELVNFALIKNRPENLIEILQDLYVGLNLESEDAQKVIQSMPRDLIVKENLEEFQSKWEPLLAELRKDPELGKKEFAKLEAGDSENREIWKKIVEVSRILFEKYRVRLGLKDFEENKGESEYEKDMPPIVEQALKNDIAEKKDGAVLVGLTDEGLDEAVLIKSDGASTYLLRDLATIKYRKSQHYFAKNLYVVDVRQSHHFRQVFRVAELLGFGGVGESKHIEFGFMKLPEGPMSTRAGNVISLNALLDEAEKRALGVINKKNPDLKDKEIVAKQVGLGAIKYFDLSHNRKSDIIFKWDEALAFDGNTGPYLQYTHARLKSILRKAGDEKYKMPDNVELDDIEHRLLAAILQFPDAIADALEEYFPNILVNYLFKLGQKINEFYHSHPVLQEVDKNKRELRLALVKCAALTLKNGLNLLGIEAPEEM